MNKLIPLLVLIILLVIGGVYFYPKNKSVTTSVPKNEASLSAEPSQMLEKSKYVFSNPKKSAHYETNTPVHEASLAAVPINVVIDFNFDLAKPSEIKILNNGQEYGVGQTVIDNNKLSMRRKMDPNSPDGLYTVTYDACWPDKSCHDGQFQFVIDRSLKGDFEAKLNQKEVEISLLDSHFEPVDIRVSRGTKVTWINNDVVEHYINTDSHPAHTYYLAQNSRALGQGDEYSVTFDTPGIYPYHCSAHEATMKGNINVE